MFRADGYADEALGQLLGGGSAAVAAAHAMPRAAFTARYVDSAAAILRITHNTGVGVAAAAAPRVARSPLGAPRLAVQRALAAHSARHDASEDLPAPGGARGAPLGGPGVGVGVGGGGGGELLMGCNCRGPSSSSLRRGTTASSPARTIVLARSPVHIGAPVGSGDKGSSGGRSGGGNSGIRVPEPRLGVKGVALAIEPCTIPLPDTLSPAMPESRRLCMLSTTPRLQVTVPSLVDERPRRPPSRPDDRHGGYRSCGGGALQPVVSGGTLKWTTLDAAAMLQQLPRKAGQPVAGASCGDSGQAAASLPPAKSPSPGDRAASPQALTPAARAAAMQQPRPLSPESALFVVRGAPASITPASMSPRRLPRARAPSLPRAAAAAAAAAADDVDEPCTAVQPRTRRQLPAPGEERSSPLEFSTVSATAFSPELPPLSASVPPWAVARPTAVGVYTGARSSLLAQQQQSVASRQQEPGRTSIELRAEGTAAAVGPGVARPRRAYPPGVKGPGAWSPVVAAPVPGVCV
jgi:hypothetical protein